MREDIKKDIIKENWYKIAYLIVVIIYSIRLNILNKELLRYPSDNVFELINYKNKAALLYFAYALILGIAGAFIIVSTYRKLKQGLETVEEVIIAIITIIGVLVLIGIIIHLIMVPIFKLIITALVIIVAGVYGTFS